MILIGLGANVAGSWGNPVATLHKAVAAFREHHFHVRAVSPFYLTEPLGPVQPIYVNAVAAVDTALPPRALLGVLKRLENAAGRKPGRRWGPRPLDLDILDYRCRILGWQFRNGCAVPQADRPLVLPHAGLHLRPFVLKPLVHIASGWHHPVLGLTAGQLLRRLRRVRAGNLIAELTDDKICV